MVPTTDRNPGGKRAKGRSIGCLIFAFMIAPWLWAIMILRDGGEHATWVKVVAYFVLAAQAIELLWILTR